MGQLAGQGLFVPSLKPRRVSNVLEKLARLRQGALGNRGCFGVGRWLFAAVCRTERAQQGSHAHALYPVQTPDWLVQLGCERVILGLELPISHEQQRDLLVLGKMEAPNVNGATQKGGFLVSSSGALVA